MGTRRTVAFALALCAAASALGDKVDDLTHALLSDGSYRVRAQAAIVLGKLHDARARGPLCDALRDDSEAVRVVAAASLGRLGDRAALDALRSAMGDPSLAVRDAAGKAIAQLEKSDAPPTGTPRGKVFVELSPIAPGQAGPELARRVHDAIARSLGEAGALSLDPAAPARARFYVDGNVTTLTTTPPDASGHVRTDCDVRVVVATAPERAIKMMATVGGSVEGTADAKDVASARSFCLDDAGKQFAARVQSFLEGQ